MRTYVFIPAILIIVVGQGICIQNAVVSTDIDIAIVHALARYHILDVKVATDRRDINIISDIHTEGAVDVIRGIFSVLIVVFSKDINARGAGTQATPNCDVDVTGRANVSITSAGVIVRRISQVTRVDIDVHVTHSVNHTHRQVTRSQSQIGCTLTEDVFC